MVQILQCISTQVQSLMAAIQGQHLMKRCHGGKIRQDARPVKICADATLVFPLLVAQTFATWHFQNKQMVNGDKGNML
ncbi:hypothetical protein MRX96_007440 [Rhipicephalus microplus]